LRAVPTGAAAGAGSAVRFGGGDTGAVGVGLGSVGDASRDVEGPSSWVVRDERLSSGGRGATGESPNGLDAAGFEVPASGGEAGAMGRPEGMGRGCSATEPGRPTGCWMACPAAALAGTGVVPPSAPPARPRPRRVHTRLAAVVRRARPATARVAHSRTRDARAWGLSARSPEMGAVLGPADERGAVVALWDTCCSTGPEARGSHGP
jgi:hypothetical protein